MNKTRLWYVRSHNQAAIKGPFPSGQISQEILLGRYQLDDEVSHDKEKWLLIGKVAELLPKLYQEDNSEPGYNGRLAAARRWADERRGVDPLDKSDERRSGESFEHEEIKRLHRLANETKKKSNRFVTFVQFSFVIITLVTTIVLAFQYSPKDEDSADCSAEPDQAVNWSNCNLSGIQLLRTKLVAANLAGVNMQGANLFASDLSLANINYAELHLANLKYVNFTKANLKGANLTGADLSNAVFNQTDLRYANLRNAIITDSNFSNARLDNAIWIDGRICKTNSVGSCH